MNWCALEVLKLWAQRFVNRQPEHYVFPLRDHGVSGDVCEVTVTATFGSGSGGQLAINPHYTH
jgi:hypothetical protein